jgi:uncharacterized repeat protein (TIGR01451 family)
VAAPAGAFVQTFTPTGQLQTYTVPPGVTQLYVVLVGGSGSSGASNGVPNAPGGQGARVQGVLDVTPGQVLDIAVGGNGTRSAGGFNGGGFSTPIENGLFALNPGGGGGRSDIRLNVDYNSAVVVAGGGGGGGASGNSSESYTGKAGGAGANAGSDGHGTGTVFGGAGGQRGWPDHAGLGGSGNGYAGDGKDGVLIFGGDGGQGAFGGGGAGGGGGGGYWGAGGGAGGGVYTGGSPIAEIGGGGGGGGSSLVPSGFSLDIPPAGTAPSIRISSLDEAPPHTLAVTKAGSGSGTVTSTPAGIDCGTTCSHEFSGGVTHATLTAQAAPGSRFVGFTGDCTSTGFTCDTSLAGDETDVTATFAALASTDVDLATTGTVDTPDPVVVGTPVTFTLTVTNRGPAGASAPDLTAPMPAGATLSPTSTGCTNVAGTLHCLSVPLAAGQSRQVQVVLVPSTAGTLSATFTAEPSGQTDPEQRNNAVTLSRTVVDQPNTTIDSGPADGSVGTDPTPTFSFSSTISGSTFKCSVDGAAYAACTSPLTLPTLAEGQHTFAVKAIRNGVEDPTPAQRSFWVDRRAPSAPTVDAYVVAVGPSYASVLSGTASDGVGIRAVRVRLDDAIGNVTYSHTFVAGCQGCGTPGTTTVSWSVDLAGRLPARGNYIATIQVEDLAGHVTTLRSAAIVVQT